MPGWKVTSIFIVLGAFMVLTFCCMDTRQATYADTSGKVTTYDSHVRAHLIANVKEIAAKQPFMVGVRLEMDPGWHTYYKYSGEAGMPTKIDWLLPEGFRAGTLEWDKPEKFDESGIVTYGYKDETLIAAQITPPVDLKANQLLTIGAKVKWLGCKDVCVPGQANLTIRLKTAEVGQLPKPINQEEFKRLGSSMPAEAATKHKMINILDEKVTLDKSSPVTANNFAYLAFAFVGGFILNFMPCVLPVISIKILSFIGQANDDPKRVFKLGLVFSLGIILSFLTLAAIVIAVQKTGQAVGWGFQFQHPAFLVFMSVLILLFSLSLFGLFYISPPSSGQASIDRLASREGYLGTFFKGVLATILATPCTAPFLGTAVGFAFTQPWWVILLVFFLVSLGMSFPYLLLTLRPGWMRHIPKPGAWMEAFKELMGFLLLGTVVWLLWILGQQEGVDALVGTLVFLLCVAVSTWMIGRFTNLTSTSMRKVIVWGLALGVVIVAYYVCFVWQSMLSSQLHLKPNLTDLSPQKAAGVTDEVNWQAFSVGLLNKELSAGKTVFLDFSADWCLTCKVNEQAVLNTKLVREKMKALRVVTMKADWTRQDEEITRLMAKFGRSGVPLYVIFPANRPMQPIVLPEVITQAIVLSKLDEAGPSRQD